MTNELVIEMQGIYDRCYSNREHVCATDAETLVKVINVLGQPRLSQAEAAGITTELVQLRGNLSLSEEGLASAMQEIERQKRDLAWQSKEIDAQVTEIQRLRGNEKVYDSMINAGNRENERLRAGLTLLTNGYKYSAEVCGIARGLLAGTAVEPRALPKVTEVTHSTLPEPPEIGVLRAWLRAIEDSEGPRTDWPATFRNRLNYLERHALKHESLDFEVIREDYQNLTGVCPLPGPPSKKLGGDQ